MVSHSCPCLLPRCDHMRVVLWEKIAWCVGLIDIYSPLLCWIAWMYCDWVWTQASPASSGTSAPWISSLWLSLPPHDASKSGHAFWLLNPFFQLPCWASKNMRRSISHEPKLYCFCQPEVVESGLWHCHSTACSIGTLNNYGLWGFQATKKWDIAYQSFISIVTADSWARFKKNNATWTDHKKPQTPIPQHFDA